MGSRNVLDIVSALGSEVSGRGLLVLLAGSFSRNEQSYISRNGELIPLSDIEFIIFQNTYQYIARYDHGIIGDIVDRLSKEFSIRIDYSIKPCAAINFIPKTFFWYEALSSSIYVCEHDRCSIKPISLNSISSGDIFEVLNHSIISILKRLVRQGDSAKTDIHFKYTVLKSSLDLLIPLLYTYGFLDSTHKKRYDKFKQYIYKRNGYFQENEQFFYLIEMVKIKSRVIDSSLLDSVSTEFLLKSYLSFSRYVYGEVNEKYGARINYFGDSSFLRKLHLLKAASRNLGKSMFILNPRAPLILYQMNFDHLDFLVNKSSDTDGSLQIDYKKYCEKFDVSTSADLFNINRLIYRYL